MANYCIYCYTNNINNKKYIGQSKNVSRRCHPSNYKGCDKFYNAIQKYGWENFTRTILSENLTLSEANELEQYYISLYNSIEDGYNLKSGGLNCEYSQESIKKMSENCHSKRKIICIETKEVYESAMEIERLFGYANTNIIACCKKKLVTAYGFHWAYLEDYQNSSYSMKQDKRKRQIYCVTLDTTYNSIAEAARATGTNGSNISACCSGRLKSTGGYQWRYAN